MNYWRHFRPGISAQEFLFAIAMCAATTVGFAAENQATNPAPAGLAPQASTLNSNLPTVFVAGDSTAANGSAGAIGWGRYLHEFFDPAKINVANRAIGGRSSRTFVSEGAWDRLLAQVKAGDYVLIQFGQNDGGEINGPRTARASLPGLGEQTQEITNNFTHQFEVVHTFGWYMRKMVADTKGRGAKPILLSLTVRNGWKDQKVERGAGRFSGWTREIAESNRVAFVDVMDLIADRYEQMGQTNVAPLFPRDFVHTSEEGAKLNATLTVSGLKGLRDNSLIRYLSAAGRAVPAAPPSFVRPAASGPRNSPGSADPMGWLNLAEPGDRSLPSVFLVGDSTVRNGRGNGNDGQWGWGDPLESYFDPAKINVVNRAVGGTGVQSFMASGYWERVLAMLKPGDAVIMQFGHNDNGARGPLRGIGDETTQRTNARSSQLETIHTFGYYLRQYIADTRAKGATPIVCSLIPRNIWKEGKIARPTAEHAIWARQVAESEKAAFIDLHELIAQRYDALGKPEVDKLFADGRVHTTWAGAELNAACVVAGLKVLTPDPLERFLVSTNSLTSGKNDFKLPPEPAPGRQ